MAEQSRTVRQFLLPLCLASLTALVFVNGVATPFVFDDRAVFESQNSIRSWENAWASGRTRRVGMLSFAANSQWHGMWPIGFRAVNIAIHVGAALALYGAVRRTLELPGIPAWLTRRSEELSILLAALWAIHPLQTESVTYVVQRFESLAGMLVFVSFYALVRGSTARRSWPWHVLGWVAVVLAVQTKETAFPWPLLALAYDRIFLSESWRELARRRGIWHGLQIACSAWLLSELRSVFDASNVSTVGLGVPGLSSWEYLRSQAGVILHYLRLVFFPDRLCLDYAWPVARSFGQIYPPGAVILASLAATVLGLCRWPRVGFLGLSFFFLLAPSSSFVPIADLAFEHRMYLPLAPLIGLIMLAVVWLAERSRASRFFQPRVLAFGVLLIIVALGVRTVLRNRDYRDPLKLWTQAIAMNPRHTRAYTWIGMYKFEQGDDAEAIRNYQEALRINRANWMAWLNLGVAHMRRNEDKSAIQCFRNCLLIRPRDSIIYQNYGSLMLRQGKKDEAIKAYRWAVHYSPDSSRMWRNLGVAYIESGERDKARATLVRAHKLDPQLPGLDELMKKLE